MPSWQQLSVDPLLALRNLRQFSCCCCSLLDYCRGSYSLVSLSSSSSCVRIMSVQFSISAAQLKCYCYCIVLYCS